MIAHPNRIGQSPTQSGTRWGHVALTRIAPESLMSCHVVSCRSPSSNYGWLVGPGRTRDGEANQP